MGKYRVFKDGHWWSVTSPCGGTLSLPTWRNVIRQVAYPERDRYFNHWKRRMRNEAITHGNPN